MSHHIRLTGHTRSYSNGTISATRECPDVFLDDKAAADAAVAGGHFCYVYDEPDSNPEETTPVMEKGHLDPEQISTMKFDEIKKLAAEMGIDTSGIKKKAELVAAICAEEVEYPADDSEEVPDGIFG